MLAGVRCGPAAADAAETIRVVFAVRVDVTRRSESRPRTGADHVPRRLGSSRAQITTVRDISPSSVFVGRLAVGGFSFGPLVWIFSTGCTLAQRRSVRSFRH